MDADRLTKLGIFAASWLAPRPGRIDAGVFALCYSMVERSRIKRLESSLRGSDIARIDLTSFAATPTRRPAWVAEAW